MTSWWPWAPTRCTRKCVCVSGGVTPGCLVALVVRLRAHHGARGAVGVWSVPCSLAPGLQITSGGRSLRCRWTSRRAWTATSTLHVSCWKGRWGARGSPHCLPWCRGQGVSPRPLTLACGLSSGLPQPGLLPALSAVQPEHHAEDVGQVRPAWGLQVVAAGAAFVSGAELGSGAPGQAAAATSFTKQMGLNILRAGYWQEPVPVGTCLCRESDKTTASPHGSW